MHKKHPTLGKITLAKMYFLRKHDNSELKNLNEDSPILESHISKDGYLKFKNQK